MTTQREPTGQATDATKVCPACAQELPLDAYATEPRHYLNRSGDVVSRVARVSRCRPCRRAYNRAYNAAVRAGLPTVLAVPRYRTCHYCHERRPLGDFAPHGIKCRACWKKDTVARQSRQAPPPRPVTLDATATLVHVLDAVAATYEVTPRSILARNRDPDTVETRKVAIRILWDLDLGVSLIGRLVSLDHSTVLHHLGCFRRATETEKWGVREVRTALGLRRRQLPEAARARIRAAAVRDQEQRLEATA